MSDEKPMTLKEYFDRRVDPDAEFSWGVSVAVERLADALRADGYCVVRGERLDLASGKAVRIEEELT